MQDIVVSGMLFLEGCWREYPVQQAVNLCADVGPAPSTRCIFGKLFLEGCRREYPVQQAVNLCTDVGPAPITVNHHNLFSTKNVIYLKDFIAKRKKASKTLLIFQEKLFEVYSL
jgi:hypothetical protein